MASKKSNSEGLHSYCYSFTLTWISIGLYKIRLTEFLFWVHHFIPHVLEWPNFSLLCCQTLIINEAELVVDVFQLKFFNENLVLCSIGVSFFERSRSREYQQQLLKMNEKLHSVNSSSNIISRYNKNIAFTKTLASTITAIFPLKYMRFQKTDCEMVFVFP